MIARKLDTKTLENTAVTSKNSARLFAPLIPFSKFLQHVARGEQEQAEAMLIEEAKSSGSGEEKEEKRAILSKLLTSNGAVTDLSGRHFAPITALQFALWAKDRHMWQMLLKYLPADKALEQYEEHKKQGVSYELEGTMIKEENHYDFCRLTNALQQYADYINTRIFTIWTPSVNRREVDKLWLKVGTAQRYVPAHVASEYVREDRSFSPTPTFDEPHLPRAKRFYNCLTRSLSAWFSDKGFGISFAVGRVKGVASGPATIDDGWASGIPSLRVWKWDSGEDQVGVDLAAISALCKVRTQEYDDLPKYLNAQLSPADDQPKVVDAPASSPRPS